MKDPQSPPAPCPGWPCTRDWFASTGYSHHILPATSRVGCVRGRIRYLVRMRAKFHLHGDMALSEIPARLQQYCCSLALGRKRSNRSPRFFDLIVNEARLFVWLIC